MNKFFSPSISSIREPTDYIIGIVYTTKSLLVDLLKPYKKYINYMTIGNHGKRPKKDYNLDIGRIVSEMLEVQYNKSD